MYIEIYMYIYVIPSLSNIVAIRAITCIMTI